MLKDGAFAAPAVSRADGPRPAPPTTPSPPTKSFDFEGLDSSKLLIIKRGNFHIHKLV